MPEAPACDAIVIGSSAHKTLFCRALIDTHVPFDVARIAWPAIDATARARIAALPFWSDAIGDERAAARKLALLAARQSDPLLAEAIALQGREEARHAAIIEGLLRAYGIAAVPPPEAPAPAKVEWAYVKLGYGECFDSFFAFGMFKLAARSGFFPQGLVELIEPVVQEEARHILFFQNWIAHGRANRSLLDRAAHRLNCARGLMVSVWTRLRFALAMRGGGGKPTSFPASGLTLRGFLELCLAENARRLAPYDARLLRPKLAPALASAVLRLLPRDRPRRTAGMGAPAA